jgi:hypothetical protein
MDLSQLTKDQLLGMLQGLQEIPSVGNLINDTVLKLPPTPEIMHVTSLIHTICCRSSHTEDGTCAWYQEEEKTDPWTRWEHQLWLDSTRKVRDHLNLSDTGMEHHTAEAASVIRRYYALTDKQKVIFHYIMEKARLFPEFPPELSQTPPKTQE